jgi:hypothetical protein
MQYHSISVTNLLLFSERQAGEGCTHSKQRSFRYDTKYFHRASEFKRLIESASNDVVGLFLCVSGAGFIGCPKQEAQEAR